MVKTKTVGYIALFPEGDTVSNTDGSIIVFGTTVAFKEYLETVGGEPISGITFHPIDYDLLLRECSSDPFALDEGAFDKFKAAANVQGHTIPHQNFAEPNDDLIKFATISTKTVLR